MRSQIEQLQRGYAKIVVATPGWLLDHLKRRTIDLHGTRFVVIDEADRMLDMGFTSDYILDEAVTLVRARTRNLKLSIELGTDVMESKTITLLSVDHETLRDSWKFYKERPGIVLSFTDATSAYLAKQHFITRHVLL